MSDEDKATSTGGGTGTATFTQADVDRIVRERLAREREKYADYDDLKTKAAGADKDKTALEKLAEQVKALTDQNAKAEERALRMEVAQAKGLTPAQAKRLQGKTRDELEADADELLAMFKPANADSADGDKTDAGKTDAGKTGESDKAAEGKGEDGKPGDKPTGGGRSLPASGRPTEKLTSGAVPATTGDKSPAELAEAILKDL